jgi:UDP-MurNAc hydroxylase
MPSFMKITFVNHASFFLESKSASLLCDPWTFGKAFNDGWALMSPSVPVPYNRVEYLWVSHEHPDHFNFPSLRAIPEADRSRITVLYQRHSSLRLVDAFHKLGFGTVQELPLYRWVQLRPDFAVLCGSVGSMDSFLAIRTEGESLLNMNDCVCNLAQLRYIRKLIGKTSLLFTQFSFANWIGNHGDEIGAVKQKLDQLKAQVECFQPDLTVPFASFIYFCNHENAWMNNFSITPAQVAAMNLSGVNFMYPGDVWDSGQRKFHTSDAISRYAADAAHMKIDPTPPAVSEEKIRDAVLKLLTSLRKRFGPCVRLMKPFDVYVHDLNRIFTVIPATSQCVIREATIENAARARYSMCSQVAWYTFANTWGWGTLAVSGMFQDRQFDENRGPDLFERSVNALSTDLFGFRSTARAARMIEFFWSKRFELLYRFLPSSPPAEPASATR